MRKHQIEYKAYKYYADYTHKELTELKQEIDKCMETYHNDLQMCAECVHYLMGESNYFEISPMHYAAFTFRLAYDGGNIYNTMKAFYNNAIRAKSRAMKLQKLVNFYE